MRRNVLYVTTRQWNPGDEFIMAGVRNIFKELGIVFGIEAIYNKSPQVMGKLNHYNPFIMKEANYSAGIADSFFKTAHFDNSFSQFDDINVFDCVVFCGSPGWFGGRLTPLYKALSKFEGELYFLGIGSSNRQVKLSKLEQSVMKRAKLITCRNEKLSSILHDAYDIPNSHITCPALLASPEEKNVKKLNKIGLVYTSAKTHRGQRVTSEHERVQNKLFQSVMNEFSDTEIICNYYSEVDYAARIFGKKNVRYQFDALDYIKLTAEFDFIVSSRVHGCGISSSLGIPNVMLGHDGRAATVKGFGSTATLAVEEILALILELHEESTLVSKSQFLLDLKRKTMNEYLTVLSGLMS